MKALSALVTAVSGKIGGMVGVNAPGGIVFRGWKKPTNPSTERQEAVRAVLADLAYDWANIMTGIQRQRWNIYASVVKVTNTLGQQVNISGIAMYQRSNVVAVINGLSKIFDGPLTHTLADQDSSMRADGSEATQLLTVTFDDTKDWCSEDDAGMQIRVSRPASPGVTFIPPTYRIAGLLAGDSGTPITSPQTVTLPFFSGDGSKIKVQGTIIRSDGRKSGGFLDSSVVLA